MTKVKTTVGKRRAKFCGWMLKKLGWKSLSGPMEGNKAIVLGVPHTSILDFPICYLFYAQYGKVAHIMVKKEFFFWPLGPILRAFGAVPVDRSNAAATVKSIIRSFNENEVFHLAIAPEGTRKPVKRWKTGFHLIARETGATVYVGYYNWGKKEITVGIPWELTDNANEDMRRIQEYYSTLDLQGRHKENYITH
ncbi:MAG: 1-acyl-sn-glycerol-3-phosphate acyltransferase [Bacteroidales bacterium]|nr:1-acyl-sn-glycerol-3-phosphate acyltransferase [Bacteroidales bacterium]